MGAGPPKRLYTGAILPLGLRKVVARAISPQERGRLPTIRDAGGLLRWRCTGCTARQPRGRSSPGAGISIFWRVKPSYRTHRIISTALPRRSVPLIRTAGDLDSDLHAQGARPTSGKVLMCYPRAKSLVAWSPGAARKVALARAAWRAPCTRRVSQSPCQHRPPPALPTNCLFKINGGKRDAIGCLCRFTAHTRTVACCPPCRTWTAWALKLEC